MILGHGIDLAEISRIDGVYKRHGKRFIDRILSEIEKNKFLSLTKQKNITYLATRFAAKEAFAKALGTGIGKISFKDIIISNDENGKPEIILSQSTLELVQSILQCYSLRFHISLSNSNENAVASVIIEQKKISKG